MILSHTDELFVVTTTTPMDSCEDPHPDDNDTDCIDPEGIPLAPRKLEDEIYPYLHTFTSGCADLDVYGFAV